MTLKIDSDSILHCPACGFHCIHHDLVETFNRNEDADEGLHIKIQGTTATTDTNLAGNPSLRRDGLKIQFWCENCDNKPVLSIEQHKGSTFIKFE